MTEQQIQKKILDYIKSINGYARKINNANMTGTPDVFACVRGYFFAFEVKAEEKEGSELQKFNIKMIKMAGGTAAVVWSVDQVKNIIYNKLNQPTKL